MMPASMTWFRELSEAATEECQRAGNPQVDVDHLLLGLLVIGGAANITLQRHGVTLNQARHAHQQQYATLVSDSTEDDATEGKPALREGWRTRIAWSDHADMLARRAAREPAPDVWLLRALLTEGTGRVRSTLSSCGVDPDSIAFEEQAKPEPSSALPTPTAPKGALAAVIEGYIPASVDAVWALVIDPGRRLAWDRYEYEDGSVSVDGVLTTSAATTAPGGRRLRVPTGLRRSEHRAVLVNEAAHTVTWRRSFPDDPAAPSQDLTIDIVPSGSGSTVRLLLISGPNRRLGRRIRRVLFRPLLRAALRANLASKLSGISRAARA